MYHRQLAQRHEDGSECEKKVQERPQIQIRQRREGTLDKGGEMVDWGDDLRENARRGGERWGMKDWRENSR